MFRGESMNRDILLNNIKNMNIWKKHDQRAPHKPLLILYALAQLQGNQFNKKRATN